jgi:hypothetical protein
MSQFGDAFPKLGETMSRLGDAFPKMTGALVNINIAFFTGYLNVNVPLNVIFTKRIMASLFMDDIFNSGRVRPVVDEKDFHQ